MPEFGSQQQHLELLDRLTGLTHDIFIGDVKDNVRRNSPTSMIFQNADPDEYRFSGQSMRFATDLRFKTGAMATDGSIPDYVGMDAVKGQLTPTRRYVRFALDNLIELLATGEGSHEDISDRIFRHLWNAWESMEIRHSVGSSSGVVCLVDSRLGNTTISVKDGYAHEGTNPLLHLSEGAIIGWYDVSGDQVGGASKITDTGINYADKEITVENSANWEANGQPSANDPIFFANTADPNAGKFKLERNEAPNGVGTLVDPAGDLTTVTGIDQGTYPRWKPFRKQSVTFDHLELMEHWLQLGAKRGYDVTPDSDRCITYPSVAHHLARSLMGFQQQAYTGSRLQGGYNTGNASGNTEDSMEPHAGLEVGGIPIYTDGFFFHDVFVTLCHEKLFRVEVGGDADYWSGDGSMWNRVAEWDGKDGFVNHYHNNFVIDRGSLGCLTEITTDVTDDDWAADVPDY